jgi:hypothetical protein
MPVVHRRDSRGRRFGRTDRPGVVARPTLPDAQISGPSLVPPSPRSGKPTGENYLTANRTRVRFPPSAGGLRCHESALASRGERTRKAVRSRTTGAAPRLIGDHGGCDALRRHEAGGRPRGRGPIPRRPCGAPPCHYNPRTRPIVVAVQSAPPATYGTPGRTGSVSAERPSQGSGIPCAILMGRAMRLLELRARRSLVLRFNLLRSRRLGFR